MCSIASLTPQTEPTQELDKNNETIVKVTVDHEKTRIKVPQA